MANSGFRKMVLVPADQLIQCGEGRGRNDIDTAASNKETLVAAVQNIRDADLRQAKKELFETPGVTAAAHLSLQIKDLLEGKYTNMTAAQQMQLLRLSREIYNNLLNATLSHRRAAAASTIVNADDPVPPGIPATTAATTVAVPVETADTVSVAKEPDTSSSTTTIADADTSRIIRSTKRRKKKTAATLLNESLLKKPTSSSSVSIKRKISNDAVSSTTDDLPSQSGHGKHSLNTNTRRALQRYSMYKL